MHENTTSSIHTDHTSQHQTVTHKQRSVHEHASGAYTRTGNGVRGRRGYSQNLNSMCGECGVEREGRGLQRRSLNGDDVSDGAGEWGAEQSGDDVRG